MFIIYPTKNNQIIQETQVPLSSPYSLASNRDAERTLRTFKDFTKTSQRLWRPVFFRMSHYLLCGNRLYTWKKIWYKEELTEPHFKLEMNLCTISVRIIIPYSRRKTLHFEIISKSYNNPFSIHQVCLILDKIEYFNTSFLKFVVEVWIVPFPFAAVLKCLFNEILLEYFSLQYDGVKFSDHDAKVKIEVSYS